MSGFGKAYLKIMINSLQNPPEFYSKRPILSSKDVPLKTRPAVAENTS